jgi:uncharacterized membrane protein YphA (DoxX/SURF4 family)
LHTGASLSASGYDGAQLGDLFAHLVQRARAPYWLVDFLAGVAPIAGQLAMLVVLVHLLGGLLLLAGLLTRTAAAALFVVYSFLALAGAETTAIMTACCLAALVVSGAGVSFSLSQLWRRSEPSSAVAKR